jgi:hypothetical protein
MWCCFEDLALRNITVQSNFNLDAEFRIYDLVLILNLQALSTLSFITCMYQ